MILTLGEKCPKCSGRIFQDSFELFCFQCGARNTRPIPQEVINPPDRPIPGWVRDRQRAVKLGIRRK